MPKSATAQSIAAGPDDYAWLTSPAAEPWLNLAAGGQMALTAKVDRLRAELSPERTHLVIEHAALRERAFAKFSAASRMFFTSRGLEQATDEIVADYKARRFAGRARVFDLCCGVGGDLLALARRGKAAGFDRDPIMAIVAAANGRTLRDDRAVAGAEESPQIEVRDYDVADLDVGQCAAWHIDPDRRPGGRRTTLVDLHEPGPAAIERLLAQNPNAGIKLAPAARLPDEWRKRAELEWISHRRECRQLVAWFGDLARTPAMRRATILGAGKQPRSIVGTADQEPPPVESIGRYVFEPDPAVLAAKLAGVLAAEHGLAAFAPGVAYWTGPRPIVDLALGCFEVLEVLPFRLKPLDRRLRALGIGQLEIKKRGVRIDPAELRGQLDLGGAESATLLLAQIERRVLAILARRT